MDVRKLRQSGIAVHKNNMSYNHPHKQYTTDWGGLMSMSEGDFDAVTPGKSLDEWVQDLVYYWDNSI